MSEVLTNRGASGMAIASLVLGILTLLTVLVWNPILQWTAGYVAIVLAIVLQVIPGLLAIALGVVAVRRARRGMGGARESASLGMLCAVIGMLPTITALLALTIAGIQGYFQDIGRIRYEDGTVHATLSIRSGLPDDAFTEEAVGGVKTRKLKSTQVSGAYVVEAETYHIDVDGQRSDIPGTYSVTSLEKGKSPSAAKRKRFVWESTETDVIRYRGVLQTLSREHLELVVYLENKVPCQFAVDGLREVVAQATGQPISLDETFARGTHSIRITGIAP